MHLAYLSPGTLAFLARVSVMQEYITTRACGHYAVEDVIVCRINVDAKKLYLSKIRLKRYIKVEMGQSSVVFLA